MQDGKEQILIVDDDARVRRLLERYLMRNGMDVYQASNGAEMRTILTAQTIDLILLDLLMPEDDGITLAREVRQGSNVPIIMLTGQSDTVDKVVGLEVGADDYVTKPFDERELLARARSVLRRRSTATEEPDQGDVVKFGGWTLNTASQELINIAGEKQYLTKHEFILLDAFLKRPNRILTRNEILDLVASREWTSTDRSIDVLVGKLRKKVEADPRNPIYIHTQRGVGYKFSPLSF
jgi:two-component system phosphate regulon response regulator OmpR